MGLVEVAPGVRLHVQDLGTGPPVVLIAGFGMSHQAWDGEVRALTEAGNRAVCIDLRGTGGSDKPLDGYGFETLARDLETVLTTLDLREVTLVGWSFGGQLSFRLAAALPDRVSRLVLVGSNAARASWSPAFPFGPPAEKLLAALTAGERANRLLARRKGLISGFATEPPETAVAFLLAIWLQMPSWAAIACYESYLTTDLCDLVEQIKVPVLQLVGDSDPVTPLAGQNWLNERLVDSRIVTLESCGHYPMLEAPHGFREALVSFVAQAASART
jgi:non-heme chloroperoxidase